MSEGEKKKFKFNWKEYAKTWGSYTPPAHPAESDIRVIEVWVKKFIDENGKSPTVMILGVTPEFRDLFSQYNCPVTLVDITPEMKMAMDTLLKESLNKAEVFVEVDWLLLDQKLEKNSFDLAIGDCVTNNIDYRNRDRFLEGIESVLKPGGYFISRNYLALEKKMTLEEILHQYDDQDEANYTVMWCDFLFNLTWNEETRTIDNQKIAELTKDAGPQYAKLLENYFKAFPPFEKIWTMPSVEEQNEEYKRFFEIEKIVHNDDYAYAEICPIYFLKKNP
ncbi:MAG: methyltransferase domain-containing protein [Patescibacteria group bacterium]|jgi:SAM-dependent methyltransferase